MTPHKEMINSLNSILNALNALIMATTLTMYYDRAALQKTRRVLHPEHKGPNSMLWYIGQYVRDLTYGDTGG